MSERRPVLLSRFETHLGRLRLPPGRVLVAVSGGMDSAVLLDLLLATGDPAGLELIVAHADHGIHPDSGAVAAEVRQLAAGAGLRCIVGRLGLGPESSETTARTARYRWLRALARRLGARHILTAHHADDQAETVLMRLLRGSGPAGLAGMSARRGMLVRPLLRFSRSALLGYAQARQLHWWEDSANQDPRHLRSWLRAQVMPALSTRLPDLTRSLGRAARHAARDRRAWKDALAGWPGLGWQRASRGQTASIHWGTLLAMPLPLRRAMARAFLRESGVTTGPARVARALTALAQAKSGASADLGGGWRLELAFDRLRLLRPRMPAIPVARDFGIESGELRWGEWSLKWTADTAPARQPRGGATAWFVPGTLRVRRWQPGDRVHPLGGTGHRLVVRCFQDARVPLSERDGWPVIECAGELTWIPGVCRAGGQLPTAGMLALRVDAQYHA